MVGLDGAAGGDGESVVPGSPVGFDLGEVSVTTADGGHRTISVWVADSTDERGRGLMDVTDLGDADGMLFVFDSEGVARFYMWQTPMPLDIAFFDADGRFVDSAEMEPCLEPSSASCARYAPDEPFLWPSRCPPAGSTTSASVPAPAHPPVIGRTAPTSVVLGGLRVHNEISGGHPLGNRPAAAQIAAHRCQRRVVEADAARQWRARGSTPRARSPAGPCGGRPDRHSATLAPCDGTRTATPPRG